MLYFKHMSNMRHDTKIKRLIAKYGIEGYGLYNLIIESIVEGITTEKPIPDLQETCEDIALFYNGNAAKVNEIAAFMLNQGLLEVDEITGRILCRKIYKFLEQSQTRSEEIRALINNYRNTTQSQTVSDSPGQSQTFMIEQEQEQEQEQKKNKNIKGRFTPPLLTEVTEYIYSMNYGLDPQWFIDHYTSKGWMIGKNKMKDWQAAVRTCEGNRKKWGKEKSTVKGDKPTLEDKRQKYKEMFDAIQ
jgi:hypothetical protein